MGTGDNDGGSDVYKRSVDPMLVSSSDLYSDNEILVSDS